MVSLQQGALQIFCGALGTLGFALFFFVRPKHLLLATLGGALSWLIYLLVLHGGGGVFLAALVSSMAVCFWSEALARVRKAPALIFLLPGIVPQLGVGILIASEVVRLLMWSNRHRKRRLSRKTRRHPRRTDQN